MMINVSVQRYFQHTPLHTNQYAWEREAHININWSMVDLARQHSFGTTLMFTGPVPVYPRQYVCMYVCMYVCIFMKLHITAQSGPVIYSFYATACNPPGGYLS